VLVVVGLFGLLALGGFLWWAARMLKPASASWETVQVSTYDVSPGTQVELRSSSIQISDALQVTFADQTLADAEVLPGRVRFAVPELADRPAGNYPVPMAVKLGDLQVFTATLNYTVRPEVASVEPHEVHVGETITITGRSLPDSIKNVEVIVGTEKAQVIEATPSKVVARVPLIVREGSIQVPIALRAGDWEARPAVTLTVLPKRAQPLELVVTADWRQEIGAWDLSSPFGPLFLLRAPAPGPGGEPPAEVKQVQDRLRRLFTAAAEDPELQLEAVPGDGAYRLRASSPTTRAWDVVTLTEDDLTATANARRLDTSPDLFAFWMAKVWNHFLQTFARGQKPAVAPSSPPYVPVLGRLVDVNLAAGGNGRPEAIDLQGLSRGEKAALAEAFFTVPAGQGSVAGKWTARLANFDPDDPDYVIELHLDLTQRGRALSGTATAFLQSGTMTMRLPQSSVSGSVQAGLPPRVKLRMTFPRPVGTVEMEGIFEGGTLQGAYTASMVRQPGTWQAVR
jgi:hypothetical protein